MKAQFLIFFSIFLSLFTGINYYIGLKIKGILIRCINFNTSFYWIIFWIIALSYLGGRGLNKFLPDFITDFFTSIGIYWLGAMFYFFIFFFLWDIINILNKKFNIVQITTQQKDILIQRGGLGIIVLVIGLLIYGSWNAQATKVVEYEVEIKKETAIDELHAVLVSDIHLGDVVNGTSLKRMVKIINDLEPDIILFAGDIIDSRLKPYEDSEMPDILKGLRAKYGIYAALGNHEYYYEEPDEIQRHLEEVGIRVLRDESVKVEDSFYVVGRNDYTVRHTHGLPRKELSIILEDVDKSLPIILIDHNPKYLQESYNNGIDLLVSGHTHKGQIFPGGLITKILFEIDWGYLKKDGLNAIVTSGYGTWGPPLRIGSNSEIVDIRIRFVNRDK